MQKLPPFSCIWIINEGKNWQNFPTADEEAFAAVRFFPLFSVIFNRKMQKLPLFSCILIRNERKNEKTVSARERVWSRRWWSRMRALRGERERERERERQRERLLQNRPRNYSGPSIILAFSWVSFLEWSITVVGPILDLFLYWPWMTNAWCGWRCSRNMHTLFPEHAPSDRIVSQI